MRCRSLWCWGAKSRFWLVGAFLSACAPPLTQDPVVLVTIDSRPVVTSVDLAAFHEKLPEHLRSPSSGESVVRDLLQTLVDRELMVMEAAALGYADEPEVTRRLHDSLVRRVSRHVIDREIGRGATAIADRLVEETYTKEGWDRKVWLAHIVTDSERTATEIISKLRAGADFAELASEHSSALDGLRGGDMMAFFGPGDGRPELVAASRGLDGGQLVPEPVVTDDGVEVVRVIAVRSIPLNKVHPKLVSELRRRQFEAKYGGYLESLERRFDVKYGSAAIAALVDASKRGTTIPPEAFNLPLATYGAESRISLGEARRTLIARGFGRGSFADSADVVDAARRWVMADTLFLMAARAEGWLNDGVFAAETQMHYAKVMASLLHRRQVLAQVRNVEGDPHETLQRLSETYLDGLRHKYQDRLDWQEDAITAMRLN